MGAIQMVAIFSPRLLQGVKEYSQEQSQAINLFGRHTTCPFAVTAFCR